MGRSSGLCIDFRLSKYSIFLLLRTLKSDFNETILNSRNIIRSKIIRRQLFYQSCKLGWDCRKVRKRLYQVHKLAQMRQLFVHDARTLPDGEMSTNKQK